MAQNMIVLGEAMTSATTSSAALIGGGNVTFPVKNNAMPQDNAVVELVGSANAVLTVKVQYSDDGGTTWSDLTDINSSNVTFTFAATNVVLNKKFNVRLHEQMRLNVTAFTSGACSGYLLV
jgi:shikimate 5-dehydrogenase